MKTSIRTVEPERALPRRITSRDAVIVLAVAAVVVTGTFWRLYTPDFLRPGIIDYAALNTDYADQIHYLLTGEKYLSARVPPGFPLLVAGILRTAAVLHVSGGWLLALFSLVCAVATAVLLFATARAVWATVPAMIAALAWIVYPPWLYVTTYLSPEAPFIPLLVASFALCCYVLARRVRDERGASLACGFVAGLAMLVKPVAIGVGFLFAAVIFAASSGTKRRVTLASLILLGNLIAVLPWEAWVYARFGAIVPLSTGGTPSIEDGLTYAVDPLKRSHWTVPDDVRALQSAIWERSHINPSGHDTFKSTGEIAAFLAHRLGTQPWTVAKLVSIKAARSWFGTDSGRDESVLLAVNLCCLAAVMVATALAWRHGPAARGIAAAAWLLTLYFWSMTVMVLSIVRYMVPAVAVLLVLIAAAAERLLSRRRHHQPVT